MFLCGIIGHRYRSCSLASNGDMDVMLYGPWMEVVDNVWSDQLLSLNGSTVERKEEDEERARTMIVAMSMVVVHPIKPMQHAIEFGGPNMTSENEAGRDNRSSLT